MICSQVFLCGSRFGSLGSVALGTSDGSLLILGAGDKSLSEWEGNENVAAVRKNGKNKVLKVSMASCWSTPEGDTVVTGDSSGRIRLLISNGENLVESRALSMQYGNPSSGPVSIRSICLSSDKSKALVGTNCCEVIEIFLWRQDSNIVIPSSAAQPKELCRVLNRGHFKDELWYNCVVHKDPLHGTL